MWAISDFWSFLQKNISRNQTTFKRQNFEVRQTFPTLITIGILNIHVVSRLSIKHKCCCRVINDKPTYVLQRNSLCTLQFLSIMFIFYETMAKCLFILLIFMHGFQVVSIKIARYVNIQKLIIFHPFVSHF